MSSGVIRELVTLWGFDIDQKPLRELDAGINTIKGTLKAIGVAVGVAATGIGFLLNRAGGEEQTLIAFETMLGSAERARDLMKDIKQFADVTPFNTQEVVDASKGLLAFGVAQEDIIEKTRMLGDIASGVGKDKFGTLIRGFGKIKTKGKATMEELNMFLEAGVPILDELAKNLGVSKEEIFKLVSTGKVGFNEVNKALQTMSTGTGKFAGLMAKQSKSFFGLISTIQGQLDNFAKEIGAQLLPLAKELTTQFLEWFEANKDLIRSNVTTFVSNLVESMRDLISLFQTFFKTMTGVVSIMGGWNSALNTSFKLFTAIMGVGLLVGIGLITKSIWFMTASLWGNVAALAADFVLMVKMGGILPAISGLFKILGNSALWAQMKLALIPLAIGAIVVAIALIAEDIIAFSQGRDSVFGRMLNGMDKIFSTMSEKFGIFGDIGKFLIVALLTPIRAVVNGFKNILTMIDMVRGKVGFVDGLKQIGSNLKNTIGFGVGDSIRSAIGLSESAGMASEQAMLGNSPIKGLGGAPFNSANKSSEMTVNAEQTLNVNVTGMNPDDAKDMVSNSIMEKWNGMFREAIRDGESQVER